MAWYSFTEVLNAIPVFSFHIEGLYDGGIFRFQLETKDSETMDGGIIFHSDIFHPLINEYGLDKGRCYLPAEGLSYLTGSWTS